MKIRSLRHAPRVITMWIGYSEVSACCFLIKGRVVYARKQCVSRADRAGNPQRRLTTNWSKRFRR